MMRSRVVLVDLPEDGRRVMNCTRFPAEHTARPTTYLSIGARVGKVRISPHEVGIGNAVRPLRSKYFRLWRSAPITENRIDAAQRVGQACDTKRIAPFPSRSTP